MKYECYWCDAPLMRCAVFNPNDEIVCGITNRTLYGIEVEIYMFKDFVHHLRFYGLKRLILARRHADGQHG